MHQGILLLHPPAKESGSVLDPKVNADTKRGLSAQTEQSQICVRQKFVPGLYQERAPDGIENTGHE